MSELLDLAEVTALAEDCLMRAGVPQPVATCVAEEAAAAEAMGTVEHGLRAVLRDIRLIRYGQLLPEATPVIRQHAPGGLSIDANHGFAAPCLAQAAKELLQMAQAHGVAIAKISRCSDPGRALRPVSILTRSSLVGMVLGDEEGNRHSRQAKRPAPDSPFRGAVNHTITLMAALPEFSPIRPVERATAPLPNQSMPHGKISLAPELLAEIVTA